MDAANPHAPAISVDTNIVPAPSNPFRILVSDGAELDLDFSDEKLSSEPTRPPLTTNLWDGLGTDMAAVNKESMGRARHKCTSLIPLFFFS